MEFDFTASTLKLRLKSALGLAVVAAFSACTVGDGGREESGGGMPARPVEVTEVESRRMEETLNLAGSLAAKESVMIRPEVSGIVAEIFFEEGQEVQEGELLLRLDDREVVAQRHEAQVRYELARRNRDRKESLAQQNTISELEGDEALAQYRMAEAELNLLEVRFDKTRIRAPFSGVIGSRMVSPGDFVTQSTAVTQIDDLSSIKIEFFVPERYIGQVGTGTRVYLTPSRRQGQSELPLTEGVVYFVSSSVDRSKRASLVKALVQDPAESLRPGMFANIELVLHEEDSALSVPEAAILTRGDGTFLLGIEQEGDRNIIGLIPVQTGLRNDGRVQVTSPENTLASGRMIVAAGAGTPTLFPGAEVIPQPVKERMNQHRPRL
ncbi:MAG: efflux RND transporter periplasmic adaptor subunit [Opitutales bacterium]